MADSIHNNYALLLLAGGKSTRMGTDKGNLLFQDKSFLDTLLEKAESLGLCHFFLSQHSCSRNDVINIPDIHRNCGPLGGMHACMKQIPLPYCLVLPVDVPQIPSEILSGLLQEHERLCLSGEEPPALLFKHGDREEPLIGIYATSLVDTIEQYMNKGKYSIFTTLNDVGYRVWCRNIPEWQIENINTPEAYRDLQRHIKKN